MKVRFSKQHLGKSIVRALETVHSKQETTIITTEDIYIAGKGLQDLVVTVKIEINIHDKIHLIVRAENINMEKEYNEVELKLLYIDESLYDAPVELITLLTDYSGRLQRNILTILGNFTNILAEYGGK